MRPSVPVLGWLAGTPCVVLTAGASARLPGVWNPSLCGPCARPALLEVRVCGREDGRLDFLLKSLELLPMGSVQSSLCELPAQIDGPLCSQWR